MKNLFFQFKIFCLCLWAFSSTGLTADSDCCQLTRKIAPICSSRTLVEVKTGYFNFSNSTMRKVYDKGGLDLQLCASRLLWKPRNRWTINAYGAVEFFQRSGKSLNEDQNTSIWAIPVNLGLKPVYAINAYLQYYFAIGPRYFYVHQHNSSSYVYQNKSRNGIGFFVNTGFNYALSNHLIIDIFGEYSYSKVHFHSGKPGVYTKNRQIGGYTFGGGLGYQF